RTFDALNLLGGEAREGPPMLGPGNASGTNIPLDVNDGSPHGGPPLATGSLRSGHPYGRHRSAGSVRELRRGSGCASILSLSQGTLPNWVCRDTGNKCCK